MLYKVIIFNMRLEVAGSRILNKLLKMLYLFMGYFPLYIFSYSWMKHQLLLTGAIIALLYSKRVLIKSRY